MVAVNQHHDDNDDDDDDDDDDDHIAAIVIPLSHHGLLFNTVSITLTHPRHIFVMSSRSVVVRHVTPSLTFDWCCGIIFILFPFLLVFDILL